MKILQISPTYFSDQSVIGGGERYVNNVCSAATSVGKPGSVDCDILSFGEQAQRFTIYPNVQMIVVNGNPNDLPSFAGENLDNIIVEYDVVHIHQCLLPFGLFNAARAKLAGKIVIGTDHGGGEYARLESFPRLGRLFNLLHAQSAFAQSSFAQLATPVKLIRGPVNEHHFPLKRKHYQPKGPIISIGRILPHKGFDMLINALPVGEELRIIGRPHDNSYLDHLKSIAQGKNVSFLTTLDDEGIRVNLEKASLYVHASTHFGFNGHFYHKPELLAIAPIEAIMSGVPTLVSSAGALPELTILDGCIVFKDTEELCSLLKRKTELMPEIPLEKMREGAIKHYGLEQFGRLYLDSLEKTQQENKE